MINLAQPLPRLFIIMGVGGTGKSSLAKQMAHELELVFIDADDFHSLENISKMTKAIPLTDADRSNWLQLIALHIEEHILSNKNLIISCSALKEQYRTTLQITPNHIKFVYLKGTQALIETRLNARQNHFMKASLLTSQFVILEEPKNTLTIDITHLPQEISTTIQHSFGLLPKK